MSSLAGQDTSPVVGWTPPEGMSSLVVSGWRTFYRVLWRTHAVTPADYRGLYLAQLGRCYICQKARGIHPDDPSGKGGRRLGVDHNHLMSGRPAVRGLLCTGGDRTCNRIIGWLSFEAIQRAVQYVATSPAQRVLSHLDEGWTDDQVQGTAYLGGQGWQ